MKLRNIPFSPPDISEDEIHEVSETLRSGWITTGPRTKEFEKKIAQYCKTEKAVCLNSATSCMEIALRLLGVGPGDEVIVPAYTYTATASVVRHVGATLVLVDSQEDSVEMDYKMMERCITERTKVIIPVDLAGIIADYDSVLSIVESKKNLFCPSNEIQKAIGRIIILSDSAHAFGASRQGKMSGQIADFTSFSFHAVKNLTTAEGGALTWNLPFGAEHVSMDKNSCVPLIEGETWNDYLYRKTQLFSLHGQNKDALAKTKLGAWEYDIIGSWYKCNMTDIAAAIGLVQLKRYGDLVNRRHEIIRQYDKALKDYSVVHLEHKGQDFQSSGHLYLLRLLGRTREETNAVIEKMAERGIACNVHYKPLPMMTAYKALGFDIKNYPNAFRLYENEVTLPLHTKLSDEDVAYIIDNIINIIG